MAFNRARDFEEPAIVSVCCCPFCYSRARPYPCRCPNCERKREDRRAMRFAEDPCDLCGHPRACHHNDTCNGTPFRCPCTTFTKKG